MPIRHIIWDWNGTLLDDTQAGLNAVNAMLATRDLPVLTLTAYRDVFGFPVRDFYRTIGFRLEAENWDAMAREFHDLFLADTTLHLHHHAVQALESLAEAGIGQSVLSASKQSILDAMLSEYGVSRFFSCACGVDNLYGHSKIELGHALLARLGISPSSVLMVGDSLHDHEVSAALGTRCLLIAQGHQSFARLAKTGAPVLNDLSELTAWMQTANR